MECETKMSLFLKYEYVSTDEFRRASLFQQMHPKHTKSEIVIASKFQQILLYIIIIKIILLIIKVIKAKF
jgi:hypothetical protein